MTRRGGVEPLLGLAVRLRALGSEVRVCAPPNCAERVAEVGGPVVATGLLLREPGAWTVKQLRRRLGYPAMSLATLARRVREQASWLRPRLVAKGDPEEAAVLAALHQEIAALPEGAVLLAEDEA